MKGMQSFTQFLNCVNTEPLKVTVSLESRFSRNSSIAIIEKEMSYAPHDSGNVFSLVTETRLCRVGRYHSLQLNAKAKSVRRSKAI